ncbi:conserved hypothetical protein (plasmid) [Borreliella spielmanii A14S]|uniref:Uncharacterized protein n=1 Tax=Borreliella spielmanii A14S TaxID=498742 RepID=C0RBK9_9SPIR|nr:conserved hypothetical protein [Borreliella spielmanii A14S]
MLHIKCNKEKKKIKEIIVKSGELEIFIKKEILNKRIVHYTKMLTDLYKLEINRYKKTNF